MGVCGCVRACVCVCLFEDGVVNFAEIARNDLNGGVASMCILYI